MAMKSRLVLAGLWVLSLVAAAQFGVFAQRSESQLPSPGVEIRFVHTGRHHQGMPYGRLMALVDGEWMPVTLAELQGGIVPLDSRPH